MDFFVIVIIILLWAWFSYRFAMKRIKKRTDAWAKQSQEILKETNPDLAEAIKKHYK